METDRRAYDKTFDDKLNQILEYNERQDKSIATLNEIMLGNGKPENGYVVKHERLSEKVSAICSTLKTHWGLLAGIGLTTIGAVVKIAFF